MGKITVLFVICCCCLPAQAKYGGGSGTADDPYLIYTAEQMNSIGADSNNWDKCFRLMADIDLSGFTGTAFNVIGYWVKPSDNKAFTGLFDGNSHTISNFSYTSTDKNYIGLFGYVRDPNAEIKNLRLIDPNVDAGTGGAVGSLVGWLREATITNCYADRGSIAGVGAVGGLVGLNLNYGTITKCYSNSSVLGDGFVGGLVGFNTGTITNCHAKGSVFGNGRVGGLAGYNENTILDCYTSGNVTGDDGSSYVGGLCGESIGPYDGKSQSRIHNCFSNATVIGHRDVGGLIGNSGAIVTGCYSTGGVIGRDDNSRWIGGLIGYNDDEGRINNCYSTGSVTGDENVGGLVGAGGKDEVAYSFWDIETSGQTTSAGGSGKTTAEMQKAGTFIAWGCEHVWTIDEGVDYPRLVWENKPGELITVPSVLYGGGTGEADDPYLIYTAEQFNTVGLIPCHFDKHFKLMADIDLGQYTGKSFNIIGFNESYPFSGLFDGNGNTISNFTYTSTGRNYIGLFGYLSGASAEIKNLGLIYPNVDAGTGRSIGSLVGRLEGTITSCYVEGGSVVGFFRIGGLVGDNYHITIGTIGNCYSTAGVSGKYNVGGLVGYSTGTIYNCYSNGSVSGDIRVGGLVGRAPGIISNCYSTASVTGTTEVGGLAGYSGTVSNCFSTGSV
ncbi:MAG: hypothetical protein GWO10_27990, partial [candidate division Zixibacteria bacterium]|nr:hypothetical protein [candidate division Zixibacteria bacterium]